ncbi:MAG: response regulator transcription factor [Flaviramulus sp.]|nr:response regulator transcription factor [Flaviramulus sp.]NNC50396.1 response regulator transcription factor [Flaviramulus sp.]
MNQDIKILVADDHPMLLKGLRNELVEQNYNVLEGAINGAQALDIISKELPDIAILDISMPLLNGFEVIAKIKEKGLDTKIIILTSYKEKGYIIKAKKLNISGYLLKDEPFYEIKKCIQTVLKGDTYFSKVFDEIVNNEISPELEKIKFLSPSERTIVRLIAQEKSSKEISEMLFISVRTVQKHRSNIISKLELSSDSDALSLWASQNKDLFLTM